MNILLHLVT